MGWGHRLPPGIHYETGNATVNHAPRDRPIAGELGLAADMLLPSTARLTGLRIPDPQFGRKPPVGCRPSSPVPLPASRAQPEPARRSRKPRVEQLRWARCPEQGRLHLLRSAAVTGAAVGGLAQAVCGHQIPAHGLTITGGPSGALCMDCITTVPNS